MVNALIPQRAALDETLRAEDGITHHDDLRTEADIDGEFLTRLRAISFSGAAALRAGYLESLLRDYIALLRTSFDHHGYLAAHAAADRQLDNARSLAAADLRQTLHLSPSTCVFLRP